jgi:hypothetical protein
VGVTICGDISLHAYHMDVKYVVQFLVVNEIIV